MLFKHENGQMLELHAEYAGLAKRNDFVIVDTSDEEEAEGEEAEGEEAPAPAKRKR